MVSSAFRFRLLGLAAEAEIDIVGQSFTLLWEGVWSTRCLRISPFLRLLLLEKLFSLGVGSTMLVSSLSIPSFVLYDERNSKPTSTPLPLNR